MGKPKVVSKAGEKSTSTLAARGLDQADALARTQGVHGFGFTPFDDGLFAAGFPHLCLLSEDTESPAARAEQLVVDGYPYLDVVLPRAAATLFVRAVVGGHSVDLEMAREPKLSATAKKAMKRTGPLDSDEARGLIDAMSAAGDPAADRLLYVFEALLGTLEVAALVTDVLETWPAEEFFDSPVISAQWSDALGFMLLRAPGKEADALRKRLATWSEAAGLEGEARAKSGVGVLHGEPYVASPRPVVWAERSEIVRARTAAKDRPWGTLPDPRFALLGGEDAYAVELAVWPKYRDVYSEANAHQLILERFGRIRSSTTVDLAVDMAARSKAKATALAWLRSHVDFALPRVKQLSKGKGSLREAAVAALAYLDG